MILSCVNISIAFGTEQILSNVSFHVNELEKVAIVGANGAGKSTLFKIIMQQLTADSGEVILGKGASIGYLAQHQDLTSDNTIFDELLSIKEHIIQLDKNIRSMEQDMVHLSGEKLELALSKYAKLTHEFEQENGYAYRSEITGVLKGLGFTDEDFSKKTNQLSGGQKTRVSLGKLLLSKPDIILLDEPTNHLDLESISWLENYLLNYNGTVIIVAHDRYFLDKVVSKVVELSYGTSTVFSGNYTDYAKKKAQLREAKLRQYYNQQREIKHQEEVISKLRSFNREKSIKRAESREKLLQKIEPIQKPLEEDSTMDIRLEPSIISGNDVLTIENLEKSFDSFLLFKGLSFQIKRGEKISIIGNNGTGKTTILKLINKLLSPDAGKISYGSNVKIGYYDQEHQVLDMNKTIFDEIHDTYPQLTQTKIRNTLASFLFTEDDVFKRIKDLSGGERGRVSLAKLMLSEANFLILDEPTNHLDITSKEILENAINGYTGTVLYVSHDRYFINQTATRILELTNKTVLNYIGNYDYYLEKKEVTYQAANLSSTENTPSQASSAPTANKVNWQQQKDEQAKLRKIENQLKKCEEEISQLETRNEEIDQLLVQEEIYTNVEELIKLNNEKKEIEKKLEDLMKAWEDLGNQLS
ncbi:MAG: ABC-F family ATP-binding cassette domain-containing protein [Lachnospiraceae bacterium]|nr:ABC-F family ATP-binding cassette domain-containing protein [Lachnospiraceae bacterium]